MYLLVNFKRYMILSIYCLHIHMTKLICLPTRVILIDNIYSNVHNVYDSGISGILHSMRCSDHLPIFTHRSISKTVAFEAYRKK